MAFCWNCGTNLADRAKFCSECGAPRDPAAPGFPEAAPIAPRAVPVPAVAAASPAELVCAVCGQPATRRRTQTGELGPFVSKPGHPYAHSACWRRYRSGRAPAVYPGRPQPQAPQVIIQSKATKVSLMWMVFIVAVIAVLLLICFSTSIRLGPAP